MAPAKRPCQLFLASSSTKRSRSAPADSATCAQNCSKPGIMKYSEGHIHLVLSKILLLRTMLFHVRKIHDESTLLSSCPASQIARTFSTSPKDSLGTLKTFLPIRLIKWGNEKSIWDRKHITIKKMKTIKQISWTGHWESKSAFSEQDREDWSLCPIMLR